MGPVPVVRVSFNDGTTPVFADRHQLPSFKKRKGVGGGQVEGVGPAATARVVVLRVERGAQPAAAAHHVEAVGPVGDGVEIVGIRQGDAHLVVGQQPLPGEADAVEGKVGAASVDDALAVGDGGARAGGDDAEPGAGHANHHRVAGGYHGGRGPLRRPGRAVVLAAQGVAPRRRPRPARRTARRGRCTQKRCGRPRPGTG